MNYYEFPKIQQFYCKWVLIGTIHLSHRLRGYTPPFHQILVRGPWSQLRTEEASRPAGEGRRRRAALQTLAQAHAHTRSGTAWSTTACGSMAALNSGTRDGHTGGGAHGSGGSRRRDAGEASQGGEVEGVASRTEAKERERAHRGHGSTTGGHGCRTQTTA